MPGAGLGDVAFVSGDFLSLSHGYQKIMLASWDGPSSRCSFTFSQLFCTFVAILHLRSYQQLLLRSSTVLPCLYDTEVNFTVSTTNALLPKAAKVHEADLNRLSTLLASCRHQSVSPSTISSSPHRTSISISRCSSLRTPPFYIGRRP